MPNYPGKPRETSEFLASAEDVAAAACEYVLQGASRRKKADFLERKELYEGTVNYTRGTVVGVGMKRTPESRCVESYVRLDVSPRSGVHFNATNLDDHGRKAFVIEGSTDSEMPEDERIELYNSVYDQMIGPYAGSDGHTLWKIFGGPEN